MKATKIIKAIIFFALAIMFLLVSFVQVNEIITVENESFIIRQYILNPYAFEEYFKYFFAETWHNYAISGLFALLGILEMKEGVFNGN